VIIAMPQLLNIMTPVIEAIEVNVPSAKLIFPWSK